MPLDPLKHRARPTLLATANERQHVLDEIAILHGLLAAGRRPAAALPSLEPLGHALDRVHGVAVDLCMGLHRHHVEGSFQRQELSALVCLPGAGQTFGDVAIAKGDFWLAEYSFIYLMKALR